MMNSRSLRRRLTKLEAVLSILSTDDKWAIVSEQALRLLSDGDQDVIARTEGAGSAVDPSPEHVAVMARFDDAFWMAMGAANIHFTVPEMDQLLAGA
jgi:hypothetical protein